MSATVSFNRRQTPVAGRRLVDDHARGYVSDEGDARRFSDFVVDADGILRGADDYERSFVRTSRPILPYGHAERWANGRMMVDRCGDLFWRDDGELVPFAGEDIAAYESLRGYDQRKLKGYRHSMYNKRRAAA